MDKDYWIKKWQQDKDFIIENDRLKTKVYFYTPFPKSNLYGFQNGDIRKLIFCDILARYERMNERNVLFPTGCHTLCNTSFVESKKYSNILNDDIANMYTNQMLGLGIGINEAKHIDMRHNEYLANLQQAFIDLYQKGYIEYKDSKVYYDKSKNKIYDFINKTNKTQPIMHKCFVLKLEGVLASVIKDIKNLPLTEDIKNKLIEGFQPKRLMELELFVSNGTKLKVKMENPQYMGGVSFIFLNPEFIDITEYVDINEYHSVFSYLEGIDKEALFAFSGLYARNALTGKEIPIFISTLYQTDIYLGMPSVDEDDKTLAMEQGLEFISIVENDSLIHSDFLDGMTIEEAKTTIFHSFLEADIAKEHILYQNNEIVLSSLDNFGPLFPFLEDKDANKLYPLTGHLPYAFSPKLRPVLSDNVDIPGQTMNGTMNNLFTEGICPILSMVYDDIGSIVSIFSKEAVAAYKNWNGIKYLALGTQDIYPSILMPLILYNIIQKETIQLPKLFNKIDIFSYVVDIKQKDLKRSNNNLLDLDSILDKYSSDAIRIFSSISAIEQPFIFDLYQLEDLHTEMENLLDILSDIREENAKVDYALFSLVKEGNDALKNKNILKYADLIYKFIKEYALIYGLSKKQIFTFIKLSYPILPFLSEEIYQRLWNAKHSIVNEDWPN